MPGILNPPVEPLDFVDPRRLIRRNTEQQLVQPAPEVVGEAESPLIEQARLLPQARGDGPIREVRRRAEAFVLEITRRSPRYAVHEIEAQRTTDP